MEVKEFLQEAEDSMQLAVEYLDETLGRIRAGKASPRLLDAIRVDYYGEVIRLSIPPLTEDRRRQLVKQCKNEAENAKVSVRNARRDAIDGLKKEVKSNGLSEDAQKDAESQVQKIHDRFIKKIDDVYAEKEKEILTV